MIESYVKNIKNNTTHTTNTHKVFDLHLLSLSFLTNDNKKARGAQTVYSKNVWNCGCLNGTLKNKMPRSMETIFNLQRSVTLFLMCYKSLFFIQNISRP